MVLSEVADELAKADYGDARLNKRVKSIVELLGNQTRNSIPSALVSKREIEGCYRFFDNQKVTPQKLLQPHFDATLQRIDCCDSVVIAQDTTELDLSRPKQQVEGAGPMDHGPRRGAFYHPSIAFDSTGIPLGLVAYDCWTRPLPTENEPRKTQSQKSQERNAKPIEEKESFCWIKGFRAAEQVAKQCPETTCINVCDSDADIYDLFSACVLSDLPNIHLIVRAYRDRQTLSGVNWADEARRSEPIASYQVNVRARKAKTGAAKSPRKRSREARTAEIEVRKSRIELKRPPGTKKSLPASVSLSVVLCEETAPPTGEDPIVWLLITTLPIETDSDVQRVIDTYCQRWQIEVFFRTLKSGCRIERRRLETMDRIENCLALMSVLAWRLLHVCYLGRDCPEIECEVIFEPSEWRSVYAVLNIAAPEHGCPSLNDLVRAIARLGGFIDRPMNHPGTQTLWIGIQRSFDLSTAWNTFGPGSKKFSPD